MQSEAKLPAKKGQSKFGGLSSGLKKKPERSGVAKSPALKIAKKKGL